MSDQGLFTMVPTPDGEFRFTPVSAPASASNIKMLDVPWLPQNGLQVTTDDYSNSDCGTACLAMVIRSRGRLVTVDEVSKATGLPAGFKYTVPADLIKAAAKFELPLVRFVGGSLQDIEAEIRGGRPVVVLVHYPSLEKKFDANFRSGHWILVVGETPDAIICHDPYWPDSRGAFIAMPRAAFEKAWSDTTVDSNQPRQGLRLRPT